LSGSNIDGEVSVVDKLEIDLQPEDLQWVYHLGYKRSEENPCYHCKVWAIQKILNTWKTRFA